MVGSNKEEHDTMKSHTKPDDQDLAYRQVKALEGIELSVRNFAQFNELKTLCTSIKELLMNEFETMDALLNDIKEATDANAVRLTEVGVIVDAQSVRLQEIVDALRSGALTAAQAAALATKAASIKSTVDGASASLDDEVTRLQNTGVDPSNPTP